MKTSELKQMIEESVKKVFQEEIKDIVLEALRQNPSMLSENNPRPSSTMSNIESEFGSAALRKQYQSTMDEDFSFSTKDLSAPPVAFNVDPLNGTLPSQGVDLSQIMQFTNGI